MHLHQDTKLKMTSSCLTWTSKCDEEHRRAIRIRTKAVCRPHVELDAPQFNLSGKSIYSISSDQGRRLKAHGLASVCV